MRVFDEFIKEKIVRKQGAKPSRAKDLFSEAVKRCNFLKTIEQKEEYSSYILENVYDVIRELIEAKLYLEGYKSNSHEATVSYLRELGYSEGDVRFLDSLRVIRNGIKYYGESSNLDFSVQVIEFLDRIYTKLCQQVKESLE